MIYFFYYSNRWRCFYFILFSNQFFCRVSLKDSCNIYTFFLFLSLSWMDFFVIIKYHKKLLIRMETASNSYSCCLSFVTPSQFFFFIWLPFFYSWIQQTLIHVYTFLFFFCSFETFRNKCRRTCFSFFYYLIKIFDFKFKKKTAA